MSAVEKAAAKRARKAAKRASDAERTAEGRVPVFCDTSHMSDRGARVWGQSLHIPRRVLLGEWDFRSLIAAANGGEVNADTHWRRRLNARRETGPAGRPRSTATALQRRRMREALARAGSR